MAENFYQLLRQRIAEHAEKDLARFGVNLTAPEPKTPSRQRKWLNKFKAIHGMSYSTWLYKKKHGLLKEPTEEATESTVVEQESIQEVTTPCLLPVPVTA